MRKRIKSAIFNFCSAIIELVICNMHNKFGKYTYKLSCPQVNVNADDSELQLQ